MSRIVIAIAVILNVVISSLITAQDVTAIKKYYKQFGIIEISNSFMDTVKKSSTLKLNDAISVAFASNPELKAMQMEATAEQTLISQVSTYPNPEVGVELENLFGSGSYRGLSGSEYTLYVAQELVLSKKLSASRDIQLFKSTLAKLKFERERISLITKIRKAFITMSSLHHEVRVSKKLLEISNTFQNNLGKRIEAGKVSPAEAARASLISISLEIKIQNIEMQWQAEIQKLKTLMGNSGVSFSNVEAVCNLEYDIPQLQELQKLIENAPAISQSRMEIEKTDIEITLEKSKTLPNLSVSLGYRRINETNDNAVIMGASIPINIFDNNSGNIEEAIIRKNQTEHQHTGLLNNRKMELAVLYNRIMGLAQIVNKFKTKLLPKARTAFEVISKGNLAGRFATLDVLDAQRSLNELELQYIGVVANYNKNVVELEELTLTKFNANKNLRILENE